MRTIGYLLGIPEDAQAAIRKNTDDRLTIGDGKPVEFDPESFDDTNELLAEYIDWRADHPSDDLMTDLLNAEIEEDGVRRRLTRTEVLTYTNTVAGAGNETGTRLIGFTMQLLADHPDQRREIVGRPLADPAPRSRRCCATRRRHRSRPATSPTTSSTTARPFPRDRSCCC